MSHGAVTLQFSSTTNYLSNFANASGTAIASDGSNRMVWGLIVDTLGNGFGGASAATPYRHGFSLAGNTTGISLTTTTDGLDTVASDDVLFIASAVMASSTAATPPDSSLTNMNRVLSFTSMNYGGGVAQGMSYAIVWFDQLALGGTSLEGQKYGIFATGLLLPADPGTYNVSASFAGADPLKTMDYVLTVPEPSAALLGALGVLGLLRRRRN